MSTVKANSFTNIAGGNPTIPPYIGQIVQVVSKTYGDATSTTATQAYQTVTNGSLNITSKYLNSAFLVNIFMNGYMDGASGVNIGLSRTVSGTTTRLLGVDGGNGDSWMGTNHNSGHGQSWSLSRQYLDSPQVSAGTTISYNSLFGKWSGGTVGVNWDGPTYGGLSTITIMEIVK